MEEPIFRFQDYGRKGIPLVGYFDTCVATCNTVDGQNPAPVDIVNIPLFTGVYTSQVVIAGFLPSTVPQVATLQELYLFVQRCNFENSMGNVHLGKSVK